MHDRPNGICPLAKCRIQRTKENETPGAILRAGTTFGKSGKIESQNQSK
ncbi:hypothetical protein HMPREF0239_02496 [Clostridium sp. ATCC BAA-442]|nr:hypothetical protein HMPREF0239_02496 [Clostridium sp. ATCC BAA-442]